MKTKEDLQKEYDLLCGSETKHKAIIDIVLPNGIKIHKEYDLNVTLYWQEGDEGNVWISNEDTKGSGMLWLGDLEKEINSLYDARIKQFCKESDEFEAAGGEVDWF